jgi:tetratricopeptide (TPR) repeat protein
MVDKKKRVPAAKASKASSANNQAGKLSLQSCQDMYEKAMIDAENGRDKGFKRHMSQAITDGEKLLDLSKSGRQLDDTTDDITEFVAESCFELGTYVQENPDKDDPEGARCAALARPYLERAVELYRGHGDVSQSFCRPAVVALSAAYSELHQHEEDIHLCQEFVGRLTKQYNQWTPLQNDLLRSLAVAYNNLGRLDDAERTYKEIVSICKTNYGDQDERTAEAEAELLEYLEDKDYSLCECQMTPEQIEAVQKRLMETAAPK